MTAVEDLQAAVTGLEEAEHAAAAEFALLETKITELEAGSPITEAQIESLATAAKAVGDKLKADTPAAP